MKKLITRSNFKRIFDRPRFAAKYIRGKLYANLGYVFGNGYSLPPGKVFFALTGKCNLKCKMCPQDNHPSLKAELAEIRDCNIDELRKIIDDISGFSPIIMVSGGELFLHSSWKEFLSYVKDKGLYCSIGSNGTLIEEHASFLVESGIDEISISIDGPESVHDEIRGIPGSYGRSIAGIKRIKKEKERLGSSKPLVNVLFTVTAGNYKYIETVAGLMEPLGINTLRIGHLNFLYQSDFDAHMKITKELFGIDHDISWAGFISDVKNMDPEYIANAIEHVRNSDNENFKITVFPDFNRQEILQYYSDGYFRSKSFKNACIAPWDIAIIGTKGEVVLCPNYIIGNLRDLDFADVWNNEMARLFRRVIRKRKELPVCSRGCCFYYI